MDSGDADASRIRYRHGVSSRYFRPQSWVGHVLVLAAALVCLRLGWWQWDVFGEARGTGQNLGYALLWPVFAGSFIYMWLRFLHLEGQQRESDDATGTDGTRADLLGAADSLARAVEASSAPTGAAASIPYDVSAPDTPTGRSDPVGGAEPRRDHRHTRSGGVTREARTVGMGYVHVDDDDPELAAYNRALAQLAEQDERRD